VPIKKGDPYGAPGELPEGGVLVRSDAEASAALTAARTERRPFPALGLLGGDLCHTLGGGSGDELHGVRFTVDLGEALLDGRLHLFVAHLVARTRLWTRSFVAMNAQYLSNQWLGHWNLGPRAHPNDALLDTYDVHLPPGQLLPVRARLHHGVHLPHPGIKERRTAALQVELERPLPVRLDGVAVGRAKVISVRVQPDALVVLI
jgi:hypothetical protein